MGLVFLLLGAVTQALLEFEFRELLGRRKMERDISRLKDHYIICGAGRVGRSVARELARRPVPFVMIENDEQKAERYRGEFLMLVRRRLERKRAAAGRHRARRRPGGGHHHRRHQHLHRAGGPQLELQA